MKKGKRKSTTVGAITKILAGIASRPRTFATLVEEELDEFSIDGPFSAHLPEKLLQASDKTHNRQNSESILDMLATCCRKTAYEGGDRLARWTRTARMLGLFAATPIREDSTERHLSGHPCHAATGARCSKNASPALLETGGKYAGIEPRFVPPERTNNSRKESREPLANVIRDSADFRHTEPREIVGTPAIAEHGHGRRSVSSILPDTGEPGREDCIRRLPDGPPTIPTEASRMRDTPNRSARLIGASPTSRKKQLMGAGLAVASVGHGKVQARLIFAVPGLPFHRREIS